MAVNAAVHIPGCFACPSPAGVIIKMVAVRTFFERMRIDRAGDCKKILHLLAGERGGGRGDCNFFLGGFAPSTALGLRWRVAPLCSPAL